MADAIFPTDAPFTTRLAPRAGRMVIADDGTDNGHLLVSDIRGLVTSTASSSATLSTSHLGKFIDVDSSGGAVDLTLPPSSGLIDGDTIWLRHSAGANLVKAIFAATDLAWLTAIGDWCAFRWSGSTWVQLTWSIVPRVDDYTVGSSTWTKPPLAKTVTAEGCGGGAGGGAGRRGAAGTVRCAGGPGGHASFVKYTFRAAELSATESVVVGAKGNGAAAVSVNDTSGSNGGAATDTTFGSMFTAHRGFPGGGGTAASGSAGASFGGNMPGGHISGNAAAVAGGAGTVASTAYQIGNAGPGGGITAADAAAAGTNAVRMMCDGIGSQPVGGANTGVAGGDGATDSTQQWWLQGQPGAGGGANLAGAAGRGGHASGYGLGGGGGGASVNGNNSGAGGNGSDGFLRVTTSF
jgi:hypothetical protein